MGQDLRPALALLWRAWKLDQEDGVDPKLETDIGEFLDDHPVEEVGDPKLVAYIAQPYAIWD